MPVGADFDAGAGLGLGLGEIEQEAVAAVGVRDGPSRTSAGFPQVTWTISSPRSRRASRRSRSSTFASRDEAREGSPTAISSGVAGHGERLRVGGERRGGGGGVHTTRMSQTFSTGRESSSNSRMSTPAGHEGAGRGTESRRRHPDERLARGGAKKERRTRRTTGREDSKRGRCTRAIVARGTFRRRATRRGARANRRVDPRVDSTDWSSDDFNARAFLLASRAFAVTDARRHTTTRSQSVRSVEDGLARGARRACRALGACTGRSSRRFRSCSAPRTARDTTAPPPSVMLNVCMDPAGDAMSYRAVPSRLAPPLVALAVFVLFQPDTVTSFGAEDTSYATSGCTCSTVTESTATASRRRTSTHPRVPSSARHSPGACALTRVPTRPREDARPSKTLERVGQQAVASRHERDNALCPTTFPPPLYSA